MRASTDGRVSGPESSTGHEFINSAMGLIATVVLVGVVVQDSRKPAGLVDLHVKTEELFKEITQLGSVAQELASHKDRICFTGLNDVVGLLWFGNQANRRSHDSGLFADSCCKGTLETRCCLDRCVVNISAG